MTNCTELQKNLLNFILLMAFVSISANFDVLKNKNETTYT